MNVYACVWVCVSVYVYVRLSNTLKNTLLADFLAVWYYLNTMTSQNEAISRFVFNKVIILLGLYEKKGISIHPNYYDKIC